MTEEDRRRQISLNSCVQTKVAILIKVARFVRDRFNTEPLDHFGKFVHGRQNRNSKFNVTINFLRNEMSSFRPKVILY